MIKITNYTQLTQYFDLPKEAVNFLVSADEKTECGRYEFGTSCYINVIDSQTVTELAPMEAHEKYVDVQCLLVGEEKILYANKTELSVSAPYDANRDIAFYSFSSADAVTYRVGEGIVLYPNEAHLPGRAVDGAMVIKKAV